MKAYTLKKYGDPEEVLELKEVAMPEPGPGEVLIKVRASAINDYDWCITTGKPYAYRLLFGIFRPRKKLRIPGMEVAGIVEKVGSNASMFKPGDEVYGDTSDHGFGSFAEYMCIHEKALAKKPSKMTFEDAVAIPHASMLALQGLREEGQMQKGHTLLINGAGGGVGSFAVQLAKLYNMEVTAVDTGDKLNIMKQLGFDYIIDYKEKDFTRDTRRYNLILDCKTSHSPLACLRALKPHGKYVSIGGSSGKLLMLLFLSPFIHLFSNKKLRLVALKANKDLAYINELYATHKIKCQIDGPYDFDKVPWAVRRFGEGKHYGKVVISIG
jgi:NADPH:quinone reductase-like Zn-dependent oxidoreductase